MTNKLAREEEANFMSGKSNSLLISVGGESPKSNRVVMRRDKMRSTLTFDEYMAENALRKNSAGQATVAHTVLLEGPYEENLYRLANRDDILPNEARSDTDIFKFLLRVAFETLEKQQEREVIKAPKRNK